MKYNYPPLQNPCKELIEKGLCLGCNKLEEFNFKSDKNCEYAKEILKSILGEQQKI